MIAEFEEADGLARAGRRSREVIVWGRHSACAGLVGLLFGEPLPPGTGREACPTIRMHRR